MNQNQGNQPLMKVDRQQPIQAIDQNGPQMSVIRLKKHTFASSRTRTQSPTSQTSDTQQSLDQSVPTPYPRIKFMNDATGQPWKRRRLDNQKTKDTRLTVSRPLKNSSSIHGDAWRLIFSFAQPRFLLKMRHVSSLFYNILKESQIWKSSRINAFGTDVPECPFFLTEQQYVDLLVGTGCQRRKCLHRDTRKAYWTYGVRLCEDCIRQVTSTDPCVDDPTPQQVYSHLFTDDDTRSQYGTSLLDLIPTATLSSGKYCMTRPVQNGKWLKGNRNQTPLMYLKLDYQKIANEFRTIREEDWPAEKVLEWTREKYEKAVSHAEAVCRIPYCQIAISDGPADARQTIIGKRANFFVDKAAALSDPIPEDVLVLMSAYQAAITTPNQPSERAWSILLPKLLPYLDEARRLKEYKRMQAACTYNVNVTTYPPDAKTYKELHEHRSKKAGTRPKEQLFVLGLARDELSRLKDKVADEDLVLLCLRNIYDRYQQCDNKPEGLNFDGTRGEYRLSLDDAKSIVEEVLQPDVDRNTLRGVKIFESFKCAGCIRHSTGRRYSFQSGFEHMLHKHAGLVGKDLYFSRFARSFIKPNLHAGFPMSFSILSSFPWYLVEWTPSLPLLPCHAEVTTTTRWIPHSEEPYVQLAQHETTSAFAGRRVVSHDDIPPGDFSRNFIYAFKALSSSTLDPACVTKVALRYSLDLYDTSDGKDLSLDDMIDTLQMAQSTNPIMVFKSKCGACCHQLDVSKHVRFAKMPVDLRNLHQHWLDKHANDDIDWKDYFFHLPSDEELLDIMLKQDEKLADDQAKSIERETVGIRKTVRKVPNKKAAALMDKEMAMTIFGRLFIEEDRHMD